MVFQGYQALTSSLGNSSIIVSFSFSGSFILWLLGPTKVIDVQAEIKTILSGLEGIHDEPLQLIYSQRAQKAVNEETHIRSVLIFFKEMA